MTNLSRQEQSSLRLLLKENLNRDERKEVTETVRAVVHRDSKEQRELDVAKTLVKMAAPPRRRKVSKQRELDTANTMLSLSVPIQQTEQGDEPGE